MGANAPIPPQAMSAAAPEGTPPRRISLLSRTLEIFRIVFPKHILAQARPDPASRQPPIGGG